MAGTTIAETTARPFDSNPGDHAVWAVNVVANHSPDGTAGTFVCGPFASWVADVRDSTVLEGTVSLADADALLVGEGAGDREDRSVGSTSTEPGCDDTADVLVGGPAQALDREGGPVFAILYPGGVCERVRVGLPVSRGSVRPAAIETT